MNVHLRQLIGNAASHSALLTAETAGYLVLVAAEHLAEHGGRVSSLRITEGGEVTSDGVSSAARETELELRALLATLLGRARAQHAALGRVAHGGRSGALIGELQAALIPLNRAAAGRALVRWCREALRAVPTEQRRSRPANEAPVEPRVELRKAPAPDSRDGRAVNEAPVEHRVELRDEPERTAIAEAVALIPSPSASERFFHGTAEAEPEHDTLIDVETELISEGRMEPDQHTVRLDQLLSGLHQGALRPPISLSDEAASESFQELPVLRRAFGSSDYQETAENESATHTPFLGSIVTEVKAELQSPAFVALPDPEPGWELDLPSRTPAWEPAIRTEIKSSAGRASDREPEMGDDCSASERVSLDGQNSASFSFEIEAPPADAEIEEIFPGDPAPDLDFSISPSPTPSTVFEAAAKPQVPLALYTPRRSELSELLTVLGDAEDPNPQRISRELGRSIGIEPSRTPPPVAVAQVVADPPAKQAGVRIRGVVGLGTLISALVVGISLGAGGYWNGSLASGAPATGTLCMTRLKVVDAPKDAVIHLRAPALDGTLSVWAARGSEASFEELTCGEPAELLVRSAETLGHWYRIPIAGEELGPLNASEPLVVSVLER